MKLTAAALYATATAVLSAIACALVVGQLTTGIAIASLLLGMLVAGVSLWAERKKPREHWKVDSFGGLTLLAFALFALRCFLWLVFESGDNVWVLSPNNLGDMPLHLTYVRLLANGIPFWPENPIFSGAPLTYPVGMDLFNSLLALVGVDVYRGMIAVGLIGSACTASALWRWGRGFVVAGFLFAGGTLGFEFFRSGGVLVDYQSDLAHEGLVVAWKSLPLALFVTQRGFLFAIPAGLFLLASWRARFTEPERVEQRLPCWGEVLLYASMPVFHLHTFLFLSVLAACWFLSVPAARKHLGLVVGLAFLPATIMVWYITGGFHGAAVLGFKLGWMQDSPGYANPVVFWVANFGAFPFLVGWLVFRLVQQSGPKSAALFVFPAVMMFLVCCVVKFAPWEWDNTKLMIWSYLVLLPPLWSELLSRFRPAVAAVCCFLLFCSGAISLFGGMAARPTRGTGESLGVAIGVRSEIVGATVATRGIPITDRFIAHPNFDHPLLQSGRLLVMGYEGHVWSHGLPAGDRKGYLQSILRGEEGWQALAAKFGARWLYWGSQEKQAYPQSTTPWVDECRLHAAGPWGELYDLTQPAIPPEQ